MSAKKSRFDGLDVAAMTTHLKKTMLGFKLANVYDGNSLGVSGTASSSGGSGDSAKGVYMYKLADPSGGGSSMNAAKNDEEKKNDAEADGSSKEEETTAATQQQDEKRAMLLIESGVRFHPTT